MKIINMERNLKKNIDALKSAQMTDMERSILRSQIVQFMDSHPIGTQVSPYVKRSSFSLHHFTFTYVLRAAAIILVSTLAMGGTISSAANSSLPGQVLYKVKIVNEEIELAFAFSQMKKIDIQKGRVEKRLEEVQILLKDSNLSKENENLVVKHLGNQIGDITKTMENLNNTANASITLKVAEDLAPTLIANQEIISAIAEKTGNSTDPLVAEVGKSIEKINQQEEAALSTSNNESQEDLQILTETQLEKSENKLNLLNSVIHSQNPIVLLESTFLERILAVEKKLDAAYDAYLREDFQEALRLAKEAGKIAETIRATGELENILGLNTVGKEGTLLNAGFSELEKSIEEINLEDVTVEKPILPETISTESVINTVKKAIQ